MIEYLVPAFNAVNMNLSRPYPRNLLPMLFILPQWLSLIAEIRRTSQNAYSTRLVNSLTTQRRWRVAVAMPAPSEAVLKHALSRTVRSDTRPYVGTAAESGSTSSCR